MVFYEAPHKLASTLADMAAAWGGERRIAIVRELTKIHEEVIRTTLAEAAERYAQQTAKGEFVLVIEGAPEPKQEEYSAEDALQLARSYMAQGFSAAAAAKQAAAQTGRRKNELYRELTHSTDKG
jgi:16S rRNA (cytidine1402-2'-O)-methyltransferase